MLLELARPARPTSTSCSERRAVGDPPPRRAPKTGGEHGRGGERRRRDAAAHRGERRTSVWRRFGSGEGAPSALCGERRTLILAARPPCAVSTLASTMYLIAKPGSAGSSLRLARWRRWNQCVFGGGRPSSRMRRTTSLK
eukprot:6361560-Prymnesium_polylepis.1